MKVGITGANGFVGWHLRCYLYSLGEAIDEVRLADRQSFADEAVLADFVSDLDFIVHLAGVNRASDDDLMSGNVEPARQLVAALKQTDPKPCVLYSSTTHALTPTTVYGEAKKAVSDTLSAWAADSGGRFINLIIPHVFGEYCKPHYNSGVATFCHQIVQGEAPQVNPDGRLELVHVQDLVEQMVGLYSQDVTGDHRVQGYPISVPEVLARLQNLHDIYVNQMQLPDLSDDLQRRLFNTLRSYIPYPDRNRLTTLHTDNRGWLVETVKAGSGGQCFVSSTHPGITRGNHYHRYKVERFFVLQGKAEIRLRKLFTDEIIRYQVSGDSPGFVDMPTLHTHSITNIGDTELITLFWADEYFDPAHPDTYFMEVE
jgi:UDP-2-acetamido-2,6-beta-L-arabino-hexul-4-ose reductase